MSISPELALRSAFLPVFAAPPKPLPAKHYEPAIDGLRAIAVGAVFLFHLQPSWLPGGFVGVDVFFVISGFLITSIIYRGCVRGSFSLLEFYQRRAARILPVFATVALVTLAAGFLIYPPDELATLGTNFAAAMLSLENLKLMMQGNYFEMGGDSQPFLHYWSLSIEEQFYLCFPPFFLLLHRYAPRFKLGALILLGTISFLACIWLTALQPVWAFYLLPTRAFELLAGCTLAVAQAEGRQRALGDGTTFRSWSRFRGAKAATRAPRSGKALSVLGFSLIVLSILLIEEGPAFPGYVALLPVAGTTMLLAVIGMGDSSIKRLLSVPVLVFIGKISFSLYLWHWPIFSLVDYQMVFASDATRMVVKVLLSMVAAILSYRLIEGPLRIRLNQRRHRFAAYGLAFATIAIGVPLGLLVRSSTGSYINARQDELHLGGVAINPAGTGGSMALMGDSNAAMYGRMFSRIARQTDARLNVISVTGQDLLPLRQGPQNPLWSDSLSFIEEARPDVLVLACSWMGKLGEDRERLQLALETLRPHVGRIVLISQPPILPDEARREALRLGSRPPFFEVPELRTARLKVNRLVAALQSPDVTVLDVERYFTGPDGSLRCRDEAGRELFRDAYHLSGFGIELIQDEVQAAVASALGQ